MYILYAYIYIIDEVPRSETCIDTNSNIALEIKSKVMVTYVQQNMYIILNMYRYYNIII